ncbi:hypothetical protein [Thiomonas sp.]
MKKRKRQLLWTATAMLAAVTTGAFADDQAPIPLAGISVSAGQPVQAVAPEAHPGERHWRQRHRWSRSTRIEHLESVEHRLTVRAERFRTEGQDTRAAKLQLRAGHLQQIIQRLRSAG